MGLSLSESRWNQSNAKAIAIAICFSRTNARIRDLVKSCISCQRAKVGRHVISPLTSIAMLTERFNHIQVDICGPFPSSQGFSYLFICVDRYTR